MKTIEERLLTYYNDLIKHNVIVVDGPVTLDWLKRQRIVEGRKELELRFGKVTVDDILGEKTFLAKAEDMLQQVQDKGKYELLPSIACFLSWECDTVLDSENPIREKYGPFDCRIPLPIAEIPDEELSFPTLHFVEKEVPIDILKKIPIILSNQTFQENPFKVIFFQSLQQSAFYVLKDAFEEIKKEVQLITK